MEAGRGEWQWQTERNVMDMMIGQMFLKAVNMGLMAGYCMGIVLLLRFFMRKLPKIYSYVLWIPVYFRLVCPVSLQSTLSLVRMKPEPVPQNTGTPVLPRISPRTVPAGRVVKNAIQRDVQPVDAAAGAGSIQTVLMAAGILWIAVCCLLLACSAWSYVRLCLRLRGAVLLEEGVYEKEGIQTPFVTGLCRPVIFLPPGMEERDQRFVLEHERTHIRRRDHLVKQAAFLVSCVYWFHPLVWLAFYLMCRDMEMSCDECVIRKLGSDVRREYSAALLSLSSGRKVVLGSPLAFGENSIRSRIVNVLRYKKRAVWASLLMAVLTAAVMTGLILNPENDNGSTVADVQEHTGQGMPAGYKTKKTATKLQNVTIASGEMPLSNGAEVTVELCMTNGIYYDDTMSEYVPSIYTYSQNYEGNYVLRTKNRKGEIMYQSDLRNYWPDTGIDYEGGRGFNFPKEFSLNWTDYNADGCPDFTVGMPLSSSNMGYLLLTVREDGRIERLCSQELLNSWGESSVAFEHDTQAEQMPILGYAYDNTLGERGPVIYLFNEQNGMYERETDEAVGLQNYENYEGYLDEAPGESKNMYRKLDLDQDGMTDRVCRYQEGDTASFEIRFGNGDKLLIGEFEKSYVFPSIFAAKIKADEAPLILFECLDIMGDPDKETRIALYTKLGEHFVKMDLPPGADGGPYLDSKKMLAGYHFKETYDADKNKMQITFRNTDRKLEFTPEEKEDETFSWENDTAYMAQFLVHQGECCVMFCESAYGKGPWADFCYVLAVRPSARSDWNPYDFELVYAGWTDELEENGFVLMN